MTVDIDKINSEILKHPHYLLEKKRLKDTLAAIKIAIANNSESVLGRVSETRKMNIDRDHMSAKVKRYLAKVEAESLANLENMQSTPYFGRVDYHEDGKPEQEILYFGRNGFDGNGNEDYRIIDWRAKIAAIFYETNGGRASYSAPGGFYSGDVSLKRQFEIEKGELLDFNDYQDPAIMEAELNGESAAGEKIISDPFLVKRLAQSADKKLKDIVETIRGEQNEIIRQPLEGVLVLQGVAGSGKSTIALHRISYLLYNHQHLKPQEMLVIAPNKIFLNYIMAVLPDLESDGVEQATFEGLIQKNVSTPLILIRDQKTELFLTTGEEPDENILLEKIRKVCKLKGSLVFRQALMDIMKQVEKSFKEQLQPISLYAGKIELSKDELAARFDATKAPYNLKVKALRQYIEFKIKFLLETSEGRVSEAKISHLQGITKSQGMLERIRSEYENKMYYSGSLGKEEILRLEKERDQLLEDVLQEKENFINNYFQNWREENPFLLYKEIVLGDYLVELLGKEWREPLDFLAKDSSKILIGGKVERQDLAPIFYLEYLLNGLQKMTKYKHIVVDEAQDLSPFEFAVLDILNKERSFTIVGDLTQGVVAYRGLENWWQLEQIFEGQKLNYHEVNHSYRSTMNIVEFANKVIPAGLSKAIPVYRKGETPQVELTSSEADTFQRIMAKIDEYQRAGSKSVAVITKTEKESLHVYANLIKAEPKLDNLNLLRSGDESYAGGISVVPITLAKGLEFDAVLIWDASASSFPKDSFNAKLLYVAMTRALHFLHIFYRKKMSPLLKQEA